MKNLRSKMKDQKGFTLIEMLIVVAIIAILISVSIPLVNTSLEKAKRATDAANERSAKAMALAAFMTGSIDKADGTSEKLPENGNYYYLAKQGVVTGSISSFGSDKGDTEYGQCASHKGRMIRVNIASNGAVTIKWVMSNTPTESPGKDAHDGSISS